MKKKLYKNKSTGMLFGVLSGVAEYFDIDVSLVRIAYVVLSIFSTFFPGFLLYIVMALILPDKAELQFNDYDVK